jgi:hypothetical protein
MRSGSLSSLATAAVLALAGVAQAHPPVSVVMDARGFVYYSDLQNVWRISPTGTRTIAVIGVHTHQLYVDAENRLYGEDATSDDATGRPYHRVWRLDPDGTLTDVIPRRAGYLWDYGDFGFVRQSRRDRPRDPHDSPAVGARLRSADTGRPGSDHGGSRPASRRSATPTGRSVEDRPFPPHAAGHRSR